MQQHQILQTDMNWFEAAVQLAINLACACACSLTFLSTLNGNQSRPEYREAYNQSGKTEGAVCSGLLAPNAFFFKFWVCQNINKHKEHLG